MELDCHSLDTTTKISTKISKDKQNLTSKDHRIHMDFPKDLGESMEISTGMSYARCAPCKHLRRRCSVDCVLAPYFPATSPYRFSCVHKIFGASNVCRMLQKLPVQQRSEAADSMSYEAYCRIQDPVYGIVKSITHLQQQISSGLNDLCSDEITDCDLSRPTTGDWWCGGCGELPGGVWIRVTTGAVGSAGTLQLDKVGTTAMIAAAGSLLVVLV